MRVALLGTGIMGGGMARNVAAAGHELTVWNRTRSRAEELADVATVADTPAAAAEGAELLVTVLFDEDATRDAVTGPHGAFAAEHGPATWVQSATVGEGTGRLDELARAAGVTLLDAPVLGTKGPAAAGQLVTLLAGDATARATALPVVEAWSAKVVEVADEPGAASRLKLAVNSWLAVLNGGLAELLQLCRGLGVEPRTFLDTIEGGGLWAPYLGIKGRMMLEDDLEAHFPLVGLHKDVSLALDAAGAGDELPALAALRSTLAAALEQGLGDLDMAAVARALDRG